MKFICLTCLIALLAVSVIAQERNQSVPFVAYWQKGDSYDFRVTKIRKLVTDGMETQKDSSSSIINFSVLKEEKDRYEIGWGFKFSPEQMQIIKTLPKKVQKLYHEKIIYITNEVGIFLEVMNIESLQESVNATIPFIVNMKSKDAEQLEKNKKIVAPFIEMARSKEWIEQTIMKEIQLFHFVYGYEFEVGEEISYEDSLYHLSNNFPVRAHSKISFTDYNIIESIATIKHETVLNPEDATEMYSQSKTKKGKSNDILSESTNSIFKISEQSVFIYNLTTSIPKQIEYKKTSVLEEELKTNSMIYIIRIELIE